LNDPERQKPRQDDRANRRRQRWRRNFAVLLVVFALALLLLAAVSVAAFHGISGARAYVHGESQWTKAQKQAVIALLEYASTGQPEQFERFEAALEVTHGDRRARIALSREDPDYDAARQGLLDGRNRPEDIPLMMRMFVIARALPALLPSFTDAVEAWAAGDADMSRLERAAEELRARVRAHGPGSPRVREQVAEVHRIDSALTRHEDRFSQQMGQVSHQLTRFFSLAVTLMALLMIAGAAMLAWRLLRISERKDSALIESEQRYRALVDQPEVGMWQVDPEGRIVFLNPAMRRLLGLATDDEVSGSSIDRFVAERDRERVRENRRARAGGKGSALEIALQPQRGSSRITLVHGAPIHVGDALIGHVGTCVDITGRKEAERELRHQALHDTLTGLPNRKLFLDRLDMALRRARRIDAGVAVLFVDLDRFKVVNDGLGHSAGDELLGEAARRLETVVRERDSIARFGGDEFGLVLEQIATVEDAVRPAERIVDAFEPAFEVDGVTTRIRASIGVALCRGGEQEPEQLLRHADIAMYSAKRAGGGRLHVYDPERDAFQQSRLQLESDLWQAVERNQLRLFYQPIVDLSEQRVESLEALLRWQHPEHGLLEPDDFIALAEETGAIRGIGRWVAGQACRDFAWLETRLGNQAPGAVAINLSGAEFGSGTAAGDLEECCRAAGIARSALRIEVTETMVTHHPDAIREIESRGFDIVIDDFGTGYASLDRLRQVPYSMIKIDRSFVASFQQSLVDTSIIEAVMHVGDRLGVRVVAEGIERPDQLPPLRAMGCRFAQGFHFSHPLPRERIAELCRGFAATDGEDPHA
jgi:diguanylate cyclase (GGDEF)-like protein/PAS domain S-box-containing protein